MNPSTDTRNYPGLLASLGYAGLDRGKSPKARRLVARILISSQLAVELGAT